MAFDEIKKKIPRYRFICIPECLLILKGMMNTSIQAFLFPGCSH